MTTTTEQKAQLEKAIDKAYLEYDKAKRKTMDAMRELERLQGILLDLDIIKVEW